MKIASKVARAMYASLQYDFNLARLAMMVIPANRLRSICVAVTVIFVGGGGNFIS